MPTHKTFCRLCAAACGLKLDVKNDTIVACHPNRENVHSQGYHCIKGGLSADIHHHPKRLTTSQKIDSLNQAQPIKTTTALEEIGDKLSNIVTQHGPRSVGLFIGTAAHFNAFGIVMAKAWLHALGSPNLFTTFTVDQSAKWVTASRMGVFASGKNMIGDADVILTAGANPVISHLGHPYSAFNSNKPAKWIKQAQQAGCKFIVIDPRRTETARLADVHLPIIPGEDATLFAGLIHIILKNGWHDKKFCADHIDNLDKLKISVNDFPPSYVSQRTGIAAEELIKVAKMFSHAKRPSAGSGTGPAMTAHCNQADHLIESLNAICGGYNRAGDKVQNPGVLYPNPRYAMAIPPNRSWENGVKCCGTDAGQLFGEFPSALLPNEITANSKDKIRALIVLGGNPVAAIGDPNRVVEAFEQLDLLVTVDPMMSTTAKLSDYVIAPALPYERHDISSIADFTLCNPVLQYAPPAINKPEQCIDEWEIFWHLAKKMALPLDFRYGPPFGAPYASLPEGMQLDMHSKPHIEELLEWYLSKAQVPFSELKRSPDGVKLSCDESVLPAPEGYQGKLNVAPPDLTDELSSLRLEKPDKKPFKLVSRRLAEVMNSCFHGMDAVQRKYNNTRVFMNPKDMQRENISEGDSITVASKHGQLSACAQADNTLREGVLSVSHMWGNPLHTEKNTDDAFTGRLVSLSELSSINFMPRQSAIPVSISIST